MAKSEILRKRLEVFINRYYKNQLIKGGIYALSLGAMYFFVVAMAEYFGRFGSTTRLVLLVGLVGGLSVILGYYIVYPLSKLFKIGKRISYQRAAVIIGKYFPEVDDKLLNAIQLQEISTQESNLLEASIDQKIKELSPVPFAKAINFGENMKYWPIAVVPVLVFVGVALSGEWGSFAESGRRIAEFNKEFVPVAPFEFVLLNNGETVEEGESVKIELKLVGNKIPSEVSMIIGAEEMRMTKGAGQFELTIPNVSEDFGVRFQANGFLSKTFRFEVLPLPKLNNVLLRVTPPAYTGIKSSVSELKSVHDVPEGSLLSWTLSSSKASNAWFVVDSLEEIFEGVDKNEFRYSLRGRESFEYAIDVANEEVRKRGLSGNKVHVLKDEYPEIKVEFVRDTVEPNVVYYSGTLSDDYGLSGLQIYIDMEGGEKSKKLALGSGLSQRFGDLLALDSVAGENGAEVKIYLKVWDNDGVNGAKASSSQPFVMKLKGKEERKEELSKGYQKYFKGGKQEQKDREDLKKTLEEVRRSLLEKRSLSFKEKSKLKELLEKQEELLEKQRKNDELLEKLKREEEKLGLEKEELKEQQEKMEDLKEKDEEIEDLIKVIEELMEKLDTEEMKKKLDELQRMNESNQRVEQRKEDILKDLQFKKDLLESAEKLENLAEEMKNLSEESGDDKKEQQKQDKVQEEFEKVSEKLDEMKKENPEFSEQSQQEGVEEKQEGAKEEMNKAGEKLQKQDSKGANENQKKAVEKMQEMSDGLQQSMMNMQSQANQENIETLRQILENLETVSFGVEELAARSREIKRDDPRIKQLLTEQKELMLGTELIEDSLLALASRAPEIQQLVFEELDNMKYNLEKGVESLQEVETAKAASKQQYVMTAANNLAVMLDQSLQNMMQMQAQMMQGQQQCQKPGSKPNGQSLKQMQSEMGKMMDQVKEGQKKGKDGKMSKQMVETISKQEQLRQALEEMQKGDGNDGSKGSRQKAIEELKKLQEELMEGKIADNYKERLKEIESRLLESEKADLKQKQDEKRESKTADDLKQLYSQELEKYLSEKEEVKESLDKLPVEFKGYYKGQTSQYFSIQ